MGLIMLRKSLKALSEEELLQLADEYFRQSDECFRQMNQGMSGNRNVKAAAKIFGKYIKVYERLSRMDFDKYAGTLMEKYSYFADICFDGTRNFPQGIHVLKKRLAVCRKLAETRPDLKDEIRVSYEELGDAYDGFGFAKKADQMYSIAEKMK